VLHGACVLRGLVLPLSAERRIDDDDTRSARTMGRDSLTRAEGRRGAGDMRTSASTARAYDVREPFGSAAWVAEPVPAGYESLEPSGCRGVGCRDAVVAEEEVGA